MVALQSPNIGSELTDAETILWKQETGQIAGYGFSTTAEAREYAMAINAKLEAEFGDRATPPKLDEENQPKMRAINDGTVVVVKNISSEQFEQATGASVVPAVRGFVTR